MAHLHTEYLNRIKGALMEEFNYQSTMEVPSLIRSSLTWALVRPLRIEKIDGALADLTRISGQKPVITRAKKSIAAFKLREDMVAGCKVTCGARAYEFLERLINIALPRVRDFRGVSARSFDGHGNYAMGLKEQIVFPEIDYDQVDQIRGMDIIICTTAKNDVEAKSLLKHFNMPFSN